MSTTRVHAVGRQGIVVEGEFFQLWRVGPDGRIDRQRGLLTRDEAVAAIGAGR
jgi:hypothetical protein